jgi:hypothetical protein
MPTAQLNRQIVAAKCAFFLEAQVWPLLDRLDPERWLSNFSPVEMDHAIALLNAFIFLRQPLMDSLFLNAFQSLSRTVRANGEPFVATQATWRQFVDTALITCVRGETPNPTDSGYHFLRMARQKLGIPESRILEPEHALALLMKTGPRPVIFVDDFVGSGQQCIATWSREVGIVTPPQMMSFKRYSASVRGARFIYCPLFCTDYGKSRIEAECPGVLLRPAHFLPPEYGAFATDSNIWPADLAATAESFIDAASARAGIPQNMRRGFHNLGLALGFEHSIPDATLPLFYWNQNGWKPLVERT